MGWGYGTKAHEFQCGHSFCLAVSPADAAVPRFKPEALPGGGSKEGKANRRDILLGSEPSCPLGLCLLTKEEGIRLISECHSRCNRHGMVDKRPFEW